MFLYLKGLFEGRSLDIAHVYDHSFDKLQINIGQNWIQMEAFKYFPVFGSDEKHENRFFLYILIQFEERYKRRSEFSPIYYLLYMVSFLWHGLP